VPSKQNAAGSSPAGRAILFKIIDFARLDNHTFNQTFYFSTHGLERAFGETKTEALLMRFYFPQPDFRHFGDPPSRHPSKSSGSHFKVRKRDRKRLCEIHSSPPRFETAQLFSLPIEVTA
jgi:hypothetical protein